MRSKEATSNAASADWPCSPGRPYSRRSIAQASRSVSNGSAPDDVPTGELLDDGQERIGLVDRPDLADTDQPRVGLELDEDELAPGRADDRGADVGDLHVASSGVGLRGAGGPDHVERTVSARRVRIPSRPTRMACDALRPALRTEPIPEGRGPHVVRDPGHGGRIGRDASRVGMDALTSAIGRSIPRIDGGPKVTGRARFAADIGSRGLLHARPVLAMPAHARIERIDRDAALAVPGVVAVLVAADLPIVTDGTDRLDEPLARLEILWAGQPVALVVAETPEAAADAAMLVTVETTPLEAVIDLDRAIEPGAAEGPLRPAGCGSRGLGRIAARGGRRRIRGVHPGRTGLRQRGRSAPGSGAATSRPHSPRATSWSRVASRRAGSTRVTSNRRWRWPSSTSDGVLHVTSATQGTFCTRSELARLFGLRRSRACG